MTKKWLLSLCVALFLIVGTACGGSDGESKEAQGQEKTDGSKPDLKGIPAVVATVNGQKISKDEFVERYELQFQQVAMQSQASGEKPDQAKLKKQTVESMIGTELLLQETEKRGFDASGQEVDDALDELVEQNGLKSADEFFAAVKKQGTDEAEVRSQIEDQVKVDKLLAEEAGDTKPSDKEIEELYEQVSAQQEQAGAQGGQAQEVPPLDEVRPQLEEQLVTQKRSEAAEGLITDYRKSAKVKVNI